MIAIWNQATATDIMTLNRRIARQNVLTFCRVLSLWQKLSAVVACILIWHEFGILKGKLIVKQILKGDKMTMLRFDPFRGFESVIKKINEVAADLEKGVVIEKGHFSPRVDIYEDDKNLYLFAEIAGMSKEEVSIKINDERVLTLSGKKVRKDEDDQRAYIRNERSYGEFNRSFVLPENLDLENVKANYREGVLEISIAKKEPEPPKEISISID